MKNNIKLLLSAVLLATSFLGCRAETDLNEDDFTMIEITDNSTDSKKTKATVEDVKKMMTKAEGKLNQIKDVVQSDELKGMAKMLQQMKNALKKMIFKNGPGFQISNKTESPIWITLVLGNDIVSNQDEYGRDQIAPGEKLTMEIDTNKDIAVGVYLSDPENVTLSDTTNKLMPKPDYLYTTTDSARGKTKYFSWNPAKHNSSAKYLYPQTGRLSGLVKVSSSNYSLSNNIKQFNVILKESR